MTNQRKKPVRVPAGRPVRQSVAIERDAGALITEAERESIRDEAKKQAEDEKKKYHREQLFAAYRLEELGKLDPQEELVWITIDVHPGCTINRMEETGISFNGVHYINGRSYPMPRSRAQLLQYQMFVTNRNERLLGSPYENMRVLDRKQIAADMPVAEMEPFNDE